jgi:hypothetical protein
MELLQISNSQTKFKIALPPRLVLPRFPTMIGGDLMEGSMVWNTMLRGRRPRVTYRANARACGMRATCDPATARASPGANQAAAALRAIHVRFGTKLTI